MSKEEAIEILSEMRSEYNLFGDEEEATRYHVLSWAIKEMNSEPVKHGHWIFNPKDAIEMMFTLPKCSECGAESSDGGNYCPNCGAKMDEVEDDT